MTLSGGAIVAGSSGLAMELGRSAANRLLIINLDIFQIGSFDAVRFAAVESFVRFEQKRNVWDGQDGKFK